jgi:hypothetical protein
MSGSSSVRQSLFVAVAVGLVVAAAVGTVAAWQGYSHVCGDGGCERSTLLMHWQRIVASAGLASLLVATGFAVRGNRRATTALLLVGVLLFAAWAVLIDAYTHGWGHGPVPF